MTIKKALEEAQEEILDILKQKLPAELTYHSYEHTLDVVEATERIARGEKVSDEDLMFLKTAAVFHDAGYIFAREKHEEKSCMLATELLEKKNINSASIHKVCDLIMATVYPPHPNNKLEEIICDADLDYLGRSDYFTISKKVYEEFRHFGIVKKEDDWKRMQVKFLEAHKYFTETSKKLRENNKEENLRAIKRSISW